MFTNIGKKLKTVAQFFCWFGIILSIILAIYFISTGSELAGKSSSYYSNNSSREVGEQLKTTGWVLLFVGPLASWLSSLTLYGFGELIERVVRIDKKLSAGYQAQANNPANVVNVQTNKPVEPTEVDSAQSRKQRILQLQQLLEEGLITQEEYDEKIKTL